MKQMKTLRKKRMPPLAQSVLIFSAVFFLLAILESNQFLSAKNLLSILKFATFPGVLTIGLAFVILSGQIDLSCGMLMGLVSVLLTYFVLADIGVVWAVLLAVGIGTLCGLLNGVLTVCLKLPAFIVTIGTQQIFSGLAYLVFNSPQKVFTDPNLQKIGKISIGGVSVVFLYFVVFLLLAAFVLKYTTYGRKIYRRKCGGQPICRHQCRPHPAECVRHLRLYDLDRCCFVDGRELCRCGKRRRDVHDGCNFQRGAGRLQPCGRPGQYDRHLLWRPAAAHDHKRHEPARCADLLADAHQGPDPCAGADRGRS